MSLFEKKNNAKGTVADNPLAAGATTLNLNSGEGAKFPSSGVFILTIWDPVYSDPGDDPGMEIVWCTSRTDDALTIVRAKENTSDVSHVVSSRAEMLITAGFFTDSTYGLNTLLFEHIYNEIPSGTINGSNVTFTLANTPVTGSLLLLLNRFPQIEGAGEDFTISGDEITFNSAPPTGSGLLAKEYKKTI